MLVNQLRVKREYVNFADFLQQETAPVVSGSNVFIAQLVIFDIIFSKLISQKCCHAY